VKGFSGAESKSQACPSKQIMQRRVRPELLDRDAGTPQEVSASLADLRRINHWFGGTATTLALLRRVSAVTGRRVLSLLDVGSGTGDIAAAVQRAMAKQDVRVEVTLADRSLSHLPTTGGIAGGAKPGQMVRRCVVADALALPFAEHSFDLVTCALLAHHLEPEQLRAFTAEALRVARLAVILNDLRRSFLSLALVYAGVPLFRSRLTRHDAPASVRRAYTPAELTPLLRQPAACQVEITRHYLFRVGAIVWKRP
jgi:SAM-dependent methyltransferase